MKSAPTRTALVIVDVQNDFCEGGSLAVDGGAAVAARVSADLLRAEGAAYDVVVATRDWHQPDSTNGRHFAAAPDYDTTWPAHCVADTNGAAFHPDLDTQGVDVRVTKGWGAPAYSGFEGVAEPDQEALTGLSLDAVLRGRDIDAVDIVGIATDYCVRATALDAVARGYQTRVLVDYCAAVAPSSREEALAELAAAGVRCVTGAPQAGAAS